MNYENLKDIAAQLIGLKYDLIIVNLVVLCIAIAGVYFLTRIKKSAELREINNNFAVVLKQQAELAEETGQIKHALDKEQIYYQIKLNAYHDKSIESINDIYVAILDVRDTAKELGFNQNDIVSRKFVRTVSKFRRIFDEKKIWIPKELSDHIEAVAIEIDNRTHKFIRANIKEKHIERLSENKLNELLKDQDDFYDYIHQESIAVFDALVAKISGTVGA